MEHQESTKASPLQTKKTRINEIVFKTYRTLLMPVSKLGREHYLLFQELLANERRNNKLRAEPESSLSKHILICILFKNNKS